MLTTTITRKAFAQKMFQLAEEKKFIEFKNISEYWMQRIDGLRLPTDIVFLVGSSPYRFTAVSIDKVELDLIPEYAREILSKAPCGKLVYAITCKPVTALMGKRTCSKQLYLSAFMQTPELGGVTDGALQNM